MPSHIRRDLLEELKETERQLIELCVRNRIQAQKSPDYHDHRLNQALKDTREMLQRATASLSQ